MRPQRPDTEADLAAALRDDGRWRAEPALERVMEGWGAAGPPGRTRGPEGGADPAPPFLGPPGRAGPLGRLGPYEITGMLGRGGMGVVLKGFDPRLGRVEAIKVLDPRMAAEPGARARFLREARATAAIRHDHVATIHAVGQVNGAPYLVMEYVPGGSLQDRLERAGPLAPEEILSIGAQAAEGLAAAHAKGLIHRDVKPANILLDDRVGAKVCDFGLACAAADVGLTRPGTVVGTPAYMAPEQARGRRVDHRADLFSLGSVLYRLLAGREPFCGDSPDEVLRRVCEEEPRPIRELNPAVPAWLIALVASLHAKDPAARPRSAAEVARLLREGRPPARPGRVARTRRALAVTLVAALLGGGAGMAGISRTASPGSVPRPPRPSPSPDAPIPDGTPPGRVAVGRHRALRRGPMRRRRRVMRRLMLGAETPIYRRVPDGP